MTNFPEIREGLVIRPGDTVIFSIQDPVILRDPEAVEEFARRIKEVMPDSVEIVLTDPAQVTVAAIRKSEDRFSSAAQIRKSATNEGRFEWGYPEEGV